MPNDLRAVDLNLLKIFDAILTEGAVTRAGNRIGLSQPAMSAALVRLRDLFEARPPHFRRWDDRIRRGRPGREAYRTAAAAERLDRPAPALDCQGRIPRSPRRGRHRRVRGSCGRSAP